MKNEIKVNKANDIQIKINPSDDWSVLDAPLLIYNKWNLIEPLGKKEKIKKNLLNLSTWCSNFNKIYPYISFLANKQNNNYISLISQSFNLLNNNNIQYLGTASKLALVQVRHSITPFISSLKLQYNYNIAFKKAYFQMIHKCYDFLYSSLLEINKYKKFKYLKEIIINDINNKLKVIYNNNKYIFIYYQFLLNSGFQSDFKKYILNNILNIELSFKEDIENNFIITLFYEPN